MEHTKVNVKQTDVKQKEWRREQEEEELVSFKDIMTKQMEEKEANISKIIIKVIKEKSGLVRDTVGKCVVVFGVKVEKMPVIHSREKYDK